MAEYAFHDPQSRGEHKPPLSNYASILCMIFAYSNRVSFFKGAFRCLQRVRVRVTVCILMLQSEVGLSCTQTTRALQICELPNCDYSQLPLTVCVSKPIPQEFSSVAQHMHSVCASSVSCCRACSSSASRRCLLQEHSSCAAKATHNVCEQ